MNREDIDADDSEDSDKTSPTDPAYNSSDEEPSSQVPRSSQVVDIDAPTNEKDIKDNGEKFSNRVSSLIIKGVFGVVPDRTQQVKVLKSKFGVQPKHLTSLSPSDVMEVLARKLIKHKYVLIADGVQIDQV